MNRGRRECDPAPGVTASKPNRLRRSFRQTQQTQAAAAAAAAAAEVEPPKSQQTDLKTPTRIQGPRSAAGFSGESPHNDSDVQQDIIWDATSPSPHRLGKRGKKQRAGVVDISEIVSRIAPKHGRPKVAEPTLQQWIGDSAAIPCTPDVQVPKPKKKSPRPNGVDDLLKLAKQFDFNMFRQDEEEADDLHQQSLELLSEDILDFENDDQNDCSLPGKSHPAANAADVHLDQYMEDDLDFLFDGPTQHVSGNLSQASSAQPSQVKPASGASSKEAAGKLPASSHGSTSSTNAKVASANDEFEDDWENDDLLNDSLVLEMTQNPLSFTAPQHCSTQKLCSEINQSPARVPICGGAGSDVSKLEQDNVRQRSTFKLEPNPNFSVKRIQTDTWTNSRVDYSSTTAAKHAQQSRFSSGEAASAEGGSQCAWKTPNTVKSDPQKPRFHQSSSTKYNTTASNTSATNTAQSSGSDLLDEDLSCFFSSDPVWDDPADDDLLCELCEDVENQIQNAQNVSPPVGHVSNQRAALQPATRTWDNRIQQPANQKAFPLKQTPAAPPCASGGAARSSMAAGSVCNVTAGVRMNTATNSFRFTQTKNTTNSSLRLQGDSRVQSAPPGNNRKDQFTFKRPNNPVSMATNKALGKCSAAEIELKKQQAMERRRQRLQAQNLRAPT